jgi:hypothetical protein
VPDQRFRATIKTLSGTASSDVFSGDPSKKFDVVFSVDMKQLLTGLGMKPADIDRILATAEANAKKAAQNPNLLRPPDENAGGDGGRGGGRGQRGQGGGQGRQGSGTDTANAGRQGRQGAGDTAGAGRGGDAAGAGRAGDGRGQGGDAQGRGQGGGGNRFANLSEADRAKMQELRGKMQSAANDEERAKVQKELSDLMAKNGITMGGRGGDGQGRGQGGGFPAGGAGLGAGAGFGGGGRGARGGGSDVGDPIAMFMARGRGNSPYSDEDRKNAKLPLPPQQDSQVQVLLRPGLLADVEIEVEKIPDVLHVPAQAVFNKGGVYTVFVQGKDGKFTSREVKLIKQSESTMVLASGVQPGEVIAMSDPTAKKSDKSEKKGSSNNPMGGMPTGGGSK